MNAQKVATLAVLFLSIVITSSAFAEMKQITDKDASADYVSVITDAFTTAPTVKCGTKGRSRTDAVASVAKHLRNGSEVWVEQAGLQPALMIITYSPRKKFRFTTRITTSPDRSELAQVSTEYADFTRVNKGNLVELQMVDEYVVRETVSCDMRNI